MLRPHPEIKQTDIPKLIYEIQKFKGLQEFGFVGGETLLYIDIINQFLQDPFFDTLQKISIITNGTELKNDVVWDTICKHNNILIELSYDGYSTQESRGNDIFTDPVILNRARALNNTNRLTISTVFTKYNYDVRKCNEYIEKQLGGPYYWVLSPLLETTENKQLNDELPKDTYIASLYNYLSLYPYNRSARMTLLKYIDSMRYRNYRHEFFIEANGDIIKSCYDYSIIGNLFTDDIKVLYNKSISLLLNAAAAQCSVCPVNELCIKRPEFHSDTSCYLRIELSKLIFKLMRQYNCNTLTEWQRCLHES
jgi:hypothetical protein